MMTDNLTPEQRRVIEDGPYIKTKFYNRLYWLFLVGRAQLHGTQTGYMGEVQENYDWSLEYGDHEETGNAGHGHSSMCELYAAAVRALESEREDGNNL